MKPQNKVWQTLTMVAALAVGTAAAQEVPTPPTPAPAPAPAAPATPSGRAEARAASSAARAQARAAQAQARAAARVQNKMYVFGEGSYLGVDVQDVTSERAKALKLAEERGAEVTLVDQDSPAGKSGLKENDVVLSFNGQRVEGAEQLKRMIHETPSGRKVALGISRDGKPQTITAELADREQLAQSYKYAIPRVVVPPIPPIHIETPMVPMAPMDSIRVYTYTNSSRLGMSLEPLTPQLGDFFGAPNGQGMLVRSVEKGSAADTAGIKAGDVITKFGGERIGDNGDWRSALRDHTGSVAVTILREKKEQTLTLKTPEHRSSGAGFGQGTGEGWLEDMDFDFNIDVNPQIQIAMKQAAEGMKNAQKAMDKAMKDWDKNWEKNYKWDDSDAPAKPEIKKPTAPMKEKIKAKDKASNAA